MIIITCGIYCIENIKNNKKYIGQSIKIESRWKKHINDLIKNKHHSFYLQNSFNTRGLSSFIFYILEICDNESLNDKEEFYMNKFKTLDNKFGYNMISINNKYSVDYTKKKRSSSQVGKHIGELNNMSKISEQEANKIIEMLLKNINITKISKLLNTSYKTIYHIRNKETWTYLTDGINFSKGTSSNYKGVSWDKSCKKWKAKLTYNKKCVYLEFFKEEIEAALKRDKQAIKYFGDKAKLNFNNNIARTSRD